MPFLFKPAIYKNAALYELPRPVTSVRIQDAWDFEQFKVPLADGDAITGRSRQGVDVSIEGRFGSAAGGLTLSEQDMFEELETLRQTLDVTSDDEAYELFLYHDASSSTYRKLKNCTTVRFEYDLSEKSLFTYAAVVHAANPVIYSTAPGA